MSLVSKHHDKGTYHVFQKNDCVAVERSFFAHASEIDAAVRLQKVVPAFCRESFPSHPPALTSFTGQQKLTSWGALAIGLGDRPQGHARRDRSFDCNSRIVVWERPFAELNDENCRTRNDFDLSA